uniref:putative disease resistance protein At3g14460 n=1 Tax=Erigeron canadensis TaxID=72917 RepID=UPI001CB9D0F8|nr:putative disease resistance protein At3g14460 [Erigeron canadensis]
MAIAELFLGAFITVLFEKLTSGDLIGLAQSAGIYAELIKWNDKLAQVQAVLVDAGHKHLRQTSVQLWLNKLQHLAYDIDDVLDDLTTEAVRRELNKESSNCSTNTSKVLKIIPTKFNAFKYGRKMSFKLDEITAKLHALVEEKNMLGLTDNVKWSKRESKRSEETSLVDVSSVVGREGDKEALLGKLLGNESCSRRKFGLVSIVGLGGVGKTTLAQVLYNDKKVQDHFDLMSWVCVSEEFDVFTISKAIFKDVGGVETNFETLNQLQVALTEKLSKKRFLYVLDDVWNEDYTKWELLQRPFAAGAQGSKVIVTTRKNTVATVMDSVQAYPLEVLSNEAAISLLAQNALDKPNFDSHPALKLQGEAIVKKCGGLPLALKTLGRVLRTKSHDEEWEILLNSEIWNSHNESKILPALRLSYYDLPPHLKHMFAYCCLFPKDYMFNKNELVLLWMAEGFLHRSNGNTSMENFGRECFRELESRSFFQHSPSEKSRYTMHELINNMAMSVAGEFFFMLGDNMDVEDKNKALDKFHHFSFIRREYGLYKTFNALQRARRLRTFLALSVTIDNYLHWFYLSKKVLVEVLPQLKFLRVLSLANYSITEVPQSIGSLKHLRYLNFSKTSITCLPEQVGDLYNLQSLLVCGCHSLSSLPNSLVKLRNMRHLDITDTWRLNKLPIGIGELTGLETLSKIIIEEADGFNISHLKDLQHLRGRLTIEGLHKVTNAAHAKEANLQQKRGLCDLEMKWRDVNDTSRNEITEYEVLEGLRPFEKLTSLKILYYMGTKFPSWVGDPSFDCLTQLRLRGCGSCTCLPTLGHLPSLQKLFVGSMNVLKRVGSELLGNAKSCNGIAFPSLEILEFKDMEGWEEWSTRGDTASFPCLSEISIVNCPKLSLVAIDQSIPSLRVLHIEESPAVVLEGMISVSSLITRLTMENIQGLRQLHGEVLEHLKAVEYLSISRCEELTYLWESEDEECMNLVNLQELDISWCKNLVRLGEKKVKSVISLSSLRKVRLNNCHKLESYKCPSSIEKLEISNYDSITTSLTFPTMQHDFPPTLKILEIDDCENLGMNWLLSNFLSSVTSLTIWGMLNLSLPKGCLVHLTHLTISSCENIESIPEEGFGFLPHLCLRYLRIDDCKNLKSFPHKQLQNLTSLEDMWITDCPSMDSSFPCGMWPPFLRYLNIKGVKKPISEWGMQNYPNSLVELDLGGSDSGLVSFAKSDSRKNSAASSSFLLPSSLTSLRIWNCMELESISKGMQHLTCLQILDIDNCPKLRDLPKTRLPSLSSLNVSGVSRELIKKCSRGKKGKYWPIISQIPLLQIKEE